MQNRRIYQSYWITWPIRLWLILGIVLWKESLCKTWIVFILIKCICFIIKINHLWSRVKKHCFKKTLFSQKKTLFSQKAHCFPTCALFYPIVLKWKIITGCEVMKLFTCCWTKHPTGCRYINLLIIVNFLNNKHILHDT